MAHTCFDVQIADGIAHIIMNRPEKRNAMIAEFWTELPEIVRDIDENAKARVIVISSTGPVFCAGIDVGMFQSDIGGTQDKNHPQYGPNFYESAKRLQVSLSSLEECRIPVLSAIQGGCYGGGVDLITACDMRYGTEDSFITIYEINVGMTADVGTFPRILCQKVWCASWPIRAAKWARRNVNRAGFIMKFMRTKRACWPPS